MSRFRFSLLGLAGFVTLVAMGCASLAYASPLISGLVGLATFLFLSLGAIATVLRSQPQRSFWIGFTMVGWLYVLAMHGPLTGLSKLIDLNGPLEKAALWMPKSMVTMSDPYAGSGVSGMGGLGGLGAGMGGGEGGMGMAPATYQAVDSEYVTAFTRTSQALLTLLLACLGGFFGRWIYDRNSLQHG